VGSISPCIRENKN